MAWLCSASSGHPSIAGRGCHLTPLGDSMRHDGNPDCPCGPAWIARGNSGMWVHFAADGRVYDGPGPWASLLTVPEWRSEACMGCDGRRPTVVRDRDGWPFCLTCFDRRQEQAWSRLYGSEQSRTVTA